LTASAQGGIVYNSGFQVQNLTSEEATIQIVFYNQDGSEAATVPDTIAADDSNTYFPLNAVSDGFNGSVVISSDKDIRAIANVLGDGLDYGASYSGFTEGSTTVSLPLLMKENSGFTTWFNVQNAGSAATDVTITYDDGVTNSCTGLQPGAACTLDQGDEAHATGWVGSATVTADEPVVVSVMEVGATTLFGYSGFTGGSSDVAMPLINANNSGYVTGVQIQNMSGSSTNVTVSYTPSVAGTACEETQTIAANSSATFALNAFTTGANSDCAAGATFVGSARVTNNSAGASLVAIVNQLNLGANKGAAYEGFDPDSATNSVVMPLIMDRNSGYFTGFSVANVGGGSATVNCSFSGTSVTESATLAAGEALAAIQSGAIADGYVGSATCTAGSGAQIIGVVNELNTGLSGDAFLVYDAFGN
jgi:hypothetical protein